MDRELPSGPRRFASPQDNAVERVWDGEMAGRTDPPHQPRRPTQVSAPGVIHRPQPDADAGHAPRPKVEFMRPPSRRAPASPRRTLGLLGTALLAASAAACGQADADPVATRTSSAPVQVPVASTSSAAPATSSTTGFDVVAHMPAAATAHTDQGAEAFARYFFEAAAKLGTNPATGNLPRLCGHDFTWCSNTEKSLQWLAEKKYRSSGPEYVVGDVVANPETPDHDKRVLVTIGLHQLSTRILDDQGRDLGKWTTEAPPAAYIVEVSWSDRGWLAEHMVKVDATQTPPAP